MEHLIEGIAWLQDKILLRGFVFGLIHVGIMLIGYYTGWSINRLLKIVSNGFIAGIVGIGGGIFLSPILFLTRAGRPKHIVTTASLFILINSVSGIIGQLTKNAVLIEIPNYWYLLVTVLIGGLVGNFLNLKVFPTRVLALVTSCLVLFVAIRMGYKLFV